MERTEVLLRCVDCERTHGHIFFEPTPAGTINVKCPNCGEFQDHDVVDPLR